MQQANTPLAAELVLDTHRVRRGADMKDTNVPTQYNRQIDILAAAAYPERPADVGAHRSFEPGPVVAPLLGGVDVGGALVVWLREHAHDRHEDLFHRLHRAPPLAALLITELVLARGVEDRDAHLTVGVDVRVPEGRRERHDRRVQRVVFGELQRGAEAPILVHGLLRPGDVRLPGEEVVFRARPRHDALRRVSSDFWGKRCGAVRRGEEGCRGARAEGSGAEQAKERRRKTEWAKTE